ncbi:Hypothetical predicted protein [Octopus vulgaris]|uniref:Uncharacterized protein n=1 Tax=Octopus vulgaris TaxID=6645 RepID=A0AA36AM92_OCTVU|nr:Hypothetical predicted protein [Octopus vulgaris]
MSSTFSYQRNYNSEFGPGILKIAHSEIKRNLQILAFLLCRRCGFDRLRLTELTSYSKEYKSFVLKSLRSFNEYTILSVATREKGVLQWKNTFSATEDNQVSNDEDKLFDRLNLPPNRRYTKLNSTSLVKLQE